ncbi:tripartite tricarboxylate transporter substrate binding protein [soil metagenome]
MKRLLKFAMTAMAAVLSAGTAIAEEFPSRPITVIVSAPAGGTTDVLARLLAVPMGRALGQAMIIENVGGAGGRIGTGKAAHAKPDGYTLNLGNSGFLAASVALYPKLDWDSRKDFAPVGLVATLPMTLAVGVSTPYHDLKSLMDAMASKPGMTTIATPGPGSTSDLAAAIFLSRASLKANVINYKGGGPALNDVMAGHVDMIFDQTSGILPMHKAGRVRALAVSAERRLPQSPDVPTFREAGLADYNVRIWNALVAPTGTPRPVLEKLEKALSLALDDPEFKAALDKVAGEAPTPDERGPARLRQLLVADVDRFTKLVRETGMKVE